MSLEPFGLFLLSIQLELYESYMMENIWGRLKEPQKLTLYTGSPSDEVQNDLTKATIRKKVWEFMERNDIANFPRPVYHRIPNFKGASAAGDKVTTLSEFQEAKHVKVNRSQFTNSK